MGASERASAGRIALQNLRTWGFQGPIYPVNPRYQQLLGLRCYSTLAELPETPDAVIVALGRPQVAQAVREAAHAGARGVVLFATGFRETGGEGAAWEAQIRDTAATHHLAVNGPNGVGLLNVHDRVALYSDALPPTVKPGAIGAIVHSGSIAIGLANADRGLGFSYIFSTGNEAVLNSADYLDFLVDDPRTAVIVAFLEAFADPVRFRTAAARAATHGKPIVLLKVGRSEPARRAALAHAGRLAGQDRVHDALCAAYGITRVDDLDELMEVAKLLAHPRRPKGTGLSLITPSGGEIAMIADIAEPLGLVFPKLAEATKTRIRPALPDFADIANPLDAWGFGDLTASYGGALPALAADAAIDTILVGQDLTVAHDDAGSRHNNRLAARAAASLAGQTAKSVVFFSNISGAVDVDCLHVLEAANVPFLQGTRPALKAVAASLAYETFAERWRTRADPTRHRTAGVASLKSGRGEWAAKNMLRGYGIPVPRGQLVRTANEAARVAQDLGFPVVMKLHSPELLHKSDIGGVRLGIRNDEEVQTTFDELMRLQHGGDERMVLIEEQVQHGLEMYAGVTVDSEFGPIVLLGYGGIHVELQGAMALKLLPVDSNDVLDLVLRADRYRLLDGQRGEPARDRRALLSAVLALTELALDLGPDLIEIDINPLLVLAEGQGVVAADALVLTQQQELPAARADNPARV